MVDCFQIGNWSRCLTDLFGMDAEDCIKDNKANGDDEAGRDADSKSFPLLNELSDLLMLPKDMLLERTIRKEVSFRMRQLLYNFKFGLSPVTSLKYLFIFVYYSRSALQLVYP